MGRTVFAARKRETEKERRRERERESEKDTVREDERVQL